LFSLTGTDIESDAYGSGSYLSAIAEQYVAQSNELLCTVKHKVGQYDSGAGDIVLSIKEGGTDPDSASSNLLATSAVHYSDVPSSASSGYSTFFLSDCMKSLRGKSVENDQIMVADFLMLTKPEFMASPKSWLALI
jgi:hypothetical protein